MTTATLKDAEIFQAGTWNGRAFTEADLDGIVSSFDALKLAGRVPLKAGHDGADARSGDGAPALGWVESLRRVGNKLLADIKLTSDKLAAGIKSGAYRFCSVELLGGVKADTREIPWVLDAVALLGATQPAVGTLRDLAQSLQPMSRSGSLVFAERLSFSTHQVSEAEALRRELADARAALHRQSVSNEIERDVGTGKVPPASRERFNRLFKLTDDASYGRVTIADWQTFAASQPRGIGPEGRPLTSRVGGGQEVASGRADEELIVRSRARVKEVFAATGRTIDSATADLWVLRQDPDLGRRLRDPHLWVQETAKPMSLSIHHDD